VITVMIQFEINGPDGNPFPMWEKLIIDKLSSLPKGQGPPSPGRWTSHTKPRTRTVGQLRPPEFPPRNLRAQAWWLVG
jgi:hypothetical protein